MSATTKGFCAIALALVLLLIGVRCSSRPDAAIPGMLSFLFFGYLLALGLRFFKEDTGKKGNKKK